MLCIIRAHYAAVKQMVYPLAADEQNIALHQLCARIMLLLTNYQAQ
jgi:hypothetical protein